MQQIAANCGNGYNFLEGVESYEKKKHCKQHSEKAYGNNVIIYLQHRK
jgi:hypothetical protein